MLFIFKYHYETHYFCMLSEKLECVVSLFIKLPDIFSPKFHHIQLFLES